MEITDKKENPAQPENEVMGQQAALERADGADGADAASTNGQPVANTPENEKKGRDLDRVLKLTDSCELFHGPDRRSYISIPVKKHRETYLVESAEVRKWLRSQFFRAYRRAVNDAALDGAVKTLDAMALYECSERPVFIRVGQHEGKIYLDLANDDWQAMEVTVDGVRLLNDPPVRFRRTPGMGRLPYPAADGSFDDLRPLLNLADEDSFRLVVAWLVGALRPSGPYPLLEVGGPQGTAKSTASKIDQRMIDPNMSPARSKPREERDLFISASNCWIPTFDNLSVIDATFSDALCRISTGGGFSTRKLYADAEEMLFEVCRPVIVNGIGVVVTRGDLLDRTISITLDPITDATRKTDEEVRRMIDEAKPSILAAILHAASAALRELPTTKVTHLPRMADFALWISAAEEHLGWEKGSFLETYRENRARVHHRVMEHEPLVGEIIGFVKAWKGSWEGTASDLWAGVCQPSRPIPLRPEPSENRGRFEREADQN